MILQFTRFCQVFIGYQFPVVSYQLSEVATGGLRLRKDGGLAFG